MDTTLTVRRAALIAAVVVVALASVWLIDVEDDISLLAVAFLALWVLCLVLLSIDHKERVYRASAAYLVLFGLFHGGLLVSIVLGGSEEFVPSDTFLAPGDAWMYRGFTTQAVHLTMLGMAAFTIAATLVGGNRRAEPEIRPAEPGERHMLGVVGLVVQLTGLAIFATAVVRAGGTNVLTGGYLVFREVIKFDTPLAYAHLFLAIGPILAVVAGGRARVTAWTVFVGYAAVALLIGNRGEVLFPLVALLVVESRRGRVPRPLWTVVGSVGTLVAIGLIRQTRLSGLFGASSLSSPLDAIAEMGYSLRPATVVLGWHTWGEPFRAGETLVAVPLRFVETLTGWHGGVPQYDDRLFNVEIMTRVGPIGGSPVAESYHNFGTPGVILFMAAVGLVLALLERAPRTPRCDARLGLVLLPVLLQVRNSFAPLPLQLAIGLLLLWVVYHLAGHHEKSRDHPPAPATTAAG